MPNAIKTSKDLRHLESQIVAKGLEIRGDRAARLPRIDLVAQYGLFAKFNHYEDYFREFQRNNGELGVSFQLPVLPGPGIGALTAKRNAEVAQLRLQMSKTRNTIILTARQTYRNIEKAETRVNIGQKKPSDYLRHFYYDTCVYDPLALALLFNRVGPDRIVLGADYPVGSSDPVGDVKEAVTLSPDQLRMVAAGTAAKLLGIEARS